MGLFFGALENPIMAEEMTARQQIVYTAKQMGSRSISNAKTFAVMGLIFSAAEFVI
jgi:import inner membrane translocase subunit TIM22